MTKTNNHLPKAIVLSHAVTGLATIRGLALGGVEIHCATFKKCEPTRYSRYCKHIQLIGVQNQERALIQWIIEYAQKIGGRPVIIPTSDDHALMLARNSSLLLPHCRIWTTQEKDLLNIIQKNNLYEIARSADVPIIPSMIEPSVNQVKEWTSVHAAPYIIKPAYEGISSCSLKDKNLIINDRESLISYVENNGAEALIVQRFLQGGDEYIFDCYGLCDSDGQIVTMASHRRWRQGPKDIGTTTYGEIPASPEGKSEKDLFDLTGKLLSALNYHGIFGIEWLQDKKTGDLLFHLDFNARPFSSIGHLTACGLNLPLLGYQELIGKDISQTPKTPQLKHSFWIDVLRDLETSREHLSWSRTQWLKWLKSLLGCQSFAYWDIHDPGPGVFRTMQIFNRTVKFVIKKALSLTTSKIGWGNILRH